jgi:hypothetical protein
MKKIYEDLDSAYNDGFKRTINIPWRIWWVAAICVLWATGALSQTTYVYTYAGQSLTNGTWGPTTDGGTPLAPPASTLSGTVTLSAPLNPNQANQVVSPISWSFGVPGAITSAFISADLLEVQTNPTLSASFVFSTVNGEIVAWAVSVSWNYGTNGPVTGFGTMTSVGFDGLGSDSWMGNPESGVSHCGFVYACDGYTAFVMEPGTWVTPASALPTPANVSVLYCVNGGDVYKVVPASNSTLALVRPGTTSAGQTCALPSGVSPSWYVQITKNGGDTWSWVTLQSVGLGN